MATKKNNFLQLILLAIIILISAKTYINHSQVDNATFSPDIETLIQNIEVEEDEDIIYKRAEWGSVKLSFISPINGERESLKRYSIDLSVNTIDPREETFEFLDPYTGETITEIMGVEFDHIIPLHYVAKHNGNDWDQKTKDDFAYALDAGVPCSKTENRIKGNKGPSEYLPPINQESYCYTWLVIANRYGISLTQKDLDTIKFILKDVETCDIINNYNYQMGM